MTMQPFTVVEGIAAPLPAANLDTDVIMPKVFLKGVDRSGLADGVLHDLRFRPDGGPDPGFILNRPEWAGARFLVVGPNFGCGSSREHAVWGLMQLGIRAIIGTTYGGIFFDNCANNGLLAVSLKANEIQRLQYLVSDPSANSLTLDLRAGLIRTVSGDMVFYSDPLLRAALLEGLDAVGSTLRDAPAIRAFEAAYHSQRPWL